MKISKKQYTAACEYAADVLSKKMTAASAVKILEADFQLNPNSARDFIDDYRHLCRGEVFQRAMSGEAMRHFMSHLARRHGPEALRKATESLAKHIDYYETHEKKTLIMRKVLSEFRDLNIPLPGFSDSTSVRSAMRELSKENIRAAFDWIENGAGRQFGAARDYSVWFRRKRYPAKRVIGVALEIGSGRRATSQDFASGLNSLCFLVLRTLGYPAVDANGKAVGGSVAKDIFVDGALSEIDQAISPRKVKGQGYGLTQPQRAAVEIVAMAVAKESLKAHGFSAVKDVSATESYDFLAEMNGEEWLVEVKGTTGSSADQILLTANELALHRENAGRTCLIVVTHIDLDRKTDKATGGRASVSLPWRTEDWIFQPTAFRAVRAADCD